MQNEFNKILRSVLTLCFEVATAVGARPEVGSHNKFVRTTRKDMYTTPRGAAGDALS